MKEGITKDRSIWYFLGQLADRVTTSDYQVLDHWNADLFAIGVASATEARRLVYVSTFERHEGHYFVDCEVGGEPREDGVDPVYESVATFDCIPFEEVVKVILRHVIQGQTVDANRTKIG